ncbi:hypothetical protein NRB20_75400 [Nocardia sp. RB20]|uniref:Uncharacterized protein n=1 Tax=Nocardia macrotermitis TaxID=2585198 RepID=A0A7K0DF34_9NOCA|nr:hypothetical protein [Nocardia macrotermitis]
MGEILTDTELFGGLGQERVRILGIVVADGSRGGVRLLVAAFGVGIFRLVVVLLSGELLVGGDRFIL